MHITLVAVGSRGDVQPFIALGVALRDAGYTVRLATHLVFEAEIRAEKLEFSNLEGDPQKLLQDEEFRTWMESARNPIKFATGFKNFMGPAISRSMRDTLTASQDTDAIIVTGPAFYFGLTIAEKLKIPLIQAYLQPIHPTGEFPSAMFPLGLPNLSVFNYPVHVVGGQLFWQLMRPSVNQARRELFGMPPLTLFGPLPVVMRQKLPVLYGYSPEVLPKPRNWPEFLHVTGYWFLDQPAWTPPADLVAFLESGPPPVYIGFGSMADRDPQRMAEISLAALKKAGQRGLLLTGWGGLAQSDLPDEVFKVDSAPHDWLLPRMAAVVHHAGAGTTAAGLRAGKSTITIPFFGDQIFWARRVARIGAGPEPLIRKTLTADRLAEAIQQTLANEGICRQAAAIGQKIRAERGSQNAVKIISDYLHANER
ncbi:MAG TPA: glycosyltransferase [Aggregatilineales bacterium]|nr:glycosyltransferase [Aggregatilineales bacterium]